jgi:siroheme synthase
LRALTEQRSGDQQASPTQEGALHRREDEVVHGDADEVRLKGGDPFLFGRGGEELAALRAAGVDAAVVSWVSAALAAPAAADIAVTFRGVSGSVAIVSGQDAGGEVPPGLARLAAAVDTLVVLMPLATLDRLSICLQHALDAGMPAALIAGATTDQQRLVRAPLAQIARVARDAGIGAPATLVVGRVVDLLSHEGQMVERRGFEPLTSAVRAYE